jgi:NADPH2:quinone reductase
MKAWRINELGLPWEKMIVEDLELPETPRRVCKVEVEAVDLNFADILQCKGSYQVKLEPPFTPGMNALGRVIEAGEDAGFQPGDRIVGPTYKNFGGYAEQCFMPAGGARLVPDGADAIKASAMHVTYGTAWFGLHLRGKLVPGETVLVLAGAGGVGSAAIELAKVHGCWVVAAAGGSEKTDACLSMGADEVVDYNSEDLYERVMSVTDGRGVDVVYDPVGGEYFDVARRLVAWEGRYLIIGFASGTIPSAPMNHALVKNYDIVGVHMGGYRGRDNKSFDDCYEVLYEMLGNDKIHPLVDQVIGFEGLPEMMQRLANRKSKGRIMFDPSK